MIVLDASALLAYMFSKDGHEKVAACIEDSCISTVNLSEVLGRFARDGHPVSGVRAALESSSIEFVEFSLGMAQKAAELTPGCQRPGLSLGDRACLALAIERTLPLLTADRVWLELSLPIRVETIR